MECPKCHNHVEDNYRFCEKCGNDLTINPPITSNTIEMDNDVVHEVKNGYSFLVILKRNPVVTTISGISILIFLLFGFWTIRYNQLLDDIGFVSSFNIDSIDDSFNGLPGIFRDVANLRSDYDYIYGQYSIMSRTFNQDYKLMRDAYFNINDYAILDSRWGLNPLLNAYNDRPLYGEWKTNCFSSSSTYFQLTPGENGPLLGTNMPNDQVSGRSYYYFKSNDWKTIGYTNINNSNEEFESFKILSVNRTQLRIRNLKNDSIYTFSHCGY
jgi:hypothetical protein